MVVLLISLEFMVVQVTGHTYEPKDISFVTNQKESSAVQQTIYIRYTKIKMLYRRVGNLLL